MPIAAVTIGTRARGKIFDESTVNIMTDRVVDSILDELADYGYFLLQMRLGQVLQNPTGLYQSRIKIDRAGEDRVLTDSNMIYGPWLEGTGSRNQITRFKGYHTFRTVSRQLDQKKVEIAKKHIARYIGEMNA